MAGEQEQEQAPPEPDAEEDAPDDAEEEQTEPEDRKKRKQPRHPDRPEREAARYRVQRNDARRERDALAGERDGLKMELAFTRAAGQRFEDIDAAWRLADKSTLSIDVDGAVIGAQETVDAVATAHPFIERRDAEEPKERDPFATGRSSGKTMNGKRKPLRTGPSRKELESRYPALRRDR